MRAPDPPTSLPASETPEVDELEDVAAMPVANRQSGRNFEWMSEDMRHYKGSYIGPTDSMIRGPNPSDARDPGVFDNNPSNTGASAGISDLTATTYIGTTTTDTGTTTSAGFSAGSVGASERYASHYSNPNPASLEYSLGVGTNAGTITGNTNVVGPPTCVDMGTDGPILATAHVVEDPASAYVMEDYGGPPMGHCLPDTRTKGGKWLCFGIVALVVVVLGGVAIAAIMCGGGNCTAAPNNINNSPDMIGGSGQEAIIMPAAATPSTTPTTPTLATAMPTTPTEGPTGEPTSNPTTVTPTSTPTRSPTMAPTLNPTTLAPTTSRPTTKSPTGNPTPNPTTATPTTVSPTSGPTISSTSPPTPNPTAALTLSASDITEIQLLLEEAIRELTEFHLIHGELVGVIPTEMGLLTAVTSLRLSSNQVTGTIPTEFGCMTALTDLRLFSSQLSGVIPTEIGLLTALEYLWLYGNQLTGTVPFSVCSLTALTSLRVDCPEVPCSCGSQCGCGAPY